jgi:hypothetical protein
MDFCDSLDPVGGLFNPGSAAQLLQAGIRLPTADAPGSGSAFRKIYARPKTPVVIL